MSVTNSVQAITLTSILSSSVTSTYQSINPGGLTAPCFMIRIINASTEDVTISYDGVTNNEYVQSGDIAQLNFQTNSQPNNQVSKLSSGTQIWVKGTAGTGDIYLSGYTQKSLN